MNRTIFNQIIGTFIIPFILAVFTFMAVGTKDVVMIIVSVIFEVIFILFALNSIKVIKKER